MMYFLIIAVLIAILSLLLIRYYDSKQSEEYPVNYYKYNRYIDNIFCWGLCIIPMCIVVAVVLIGLLRG